MQNPDQTTEKSAASAHEAVDLELTNIDLAFERKQLRRSLLRSTIAAVAILFVAVGLGVYAAISSSSARRNQQEATENLWASLVAEAGSTSGSHPADKHSTLAAIEAAVAIRPSPDLRDRAIEALARTELRQTLKLENILGGPTDLVTSAEFSPKLELLFAGTQRGTVEQFRLPDGKHLKTFEDPEKPHFGGGVNYLLLSPDMRYLAMRHYWGAIVVWEIASGRTLLRADEPCGRHLNHRTLAFHPERTELLYISKQEKNLIEVYDLEAGETVSTISTEGAPGCMKIDNSGDRLAVKVGGHMQLFSLADSPPSVVDAIDVPGTITDLDWYTDGRRLAVGSSDAHIYVLDIEDGRVIRTIKAHDKYTWHLSLSPRGDLILSDGWDNLTRLHDTESGQLLATVKGQHPSKFREDGLQIGGRVVGDIDVFEIDRSRLYRPLGAQIDAHDRISGITFSPDGEYIAAGGRDGVFVWEASSGAVLSHKPNLGSVLGVAFSEDGRWLLANRQHSEDVLRWPVATETEVGQDLLGEAVRMPMDGAGTLEMGRTSANGRWFGFITSRDGRVIDLRKPDEIRTVVESVRFTNNVHFVVSPDEKFVAYSGWRTEMTTVWDFATGEKVTRLERFGGGAQFSPDSRFLATVAKAEVVFWDTTDWSIAGVFKRPADTASVVFGVDWSRDGRLVAIAGESGKVHLVDGRPGQLGRPLAALTAPYDDRMYRAAFSPDSTLLAVAGYEGKAHLWNLEEIERELISRKLHWKDDCEMGMGESTPSRWGSIVIVAIFGGVAALGVALFTVRQQRELIRRFATVESVAEQRAAELRSAEIRMAQSEKMKALGTLAAGVAHDFKNLLSVVKLSNDLIRRDAMGQADILEEVEAISKAVGQGDQVVKAMLGYCRHRSDEEAERVDVGDVIEGTVSLLGHKFLSGVKLQLELSGELPEVEITLGALEQILLNLVVNAAEAMVGEGELRLSAKEAHSGSEFEGETMLPPVAADRYVEIIATDNGPGIPQELRSRVLEPFFTTKKVGSQRGTGLGLATVYKICRDHGIGLGLHSSTSDPSGTSFCLRVPVQGESEVRVSRTV